MRVPGHSAAARTPERDPLRTNRSWLYAGRGLRSFTTAFLTVVFPLYLAASGRSAAEVGAVLTVGSALTGVVTLAVGLLSDRVGRRPMLVMVGFLAAVGAGLLVVSSNLLVMMLASGLGSIGRGGGAGSGGAYGPFFPAEQPMLAASAAPNRRTAAFGAIGAIGVASGALGSLVAWVPDLLRSAGMAELSAYRVVFLVGAALSMVVVAACLPLREPTTARADEEEATGSHAAGEGGPDGAGEGGDPAAVGRAGSPPADGADARRADARQRISTRQIVARMTVTNGLNGLGFGFLGPLLTYWFHVRFGVGSGDIGTVYFAINLATILPYLGAARLAGRFGPVQTVVGTRVIGTAALLAMAWAGGFDFAAALLAVRSLGNSLGNPARQSYLMGVARERRRGVVAAMANLPSQTTSSISPLVGGALMAVVEDIPLFGAAFFLWLSAGVYYLAFRNVDELEEPGGTTEEADGRAFLDEERAVL